MERIENVAGNGIPDVHLTLPRSIIRDAVTAWAELKVVKRPKRNTSKLFKKGDIRKDQRAWHISYAAAGGRGFMLARDDMRTLYLIPSKDVEHIEEKPFGEIHLRYSFTKWDEVFEEIFK